jgi:hypothetical protein
MGCVVLSSKKQSLKSRTASRFYFSSNAYSVQTLTESVEVFEKHFQVETTCNVSPLVKEDGSEILKNYEILLNLGINASEEYKFVAELMTTYQYYYSLFKDAVHGSCVKDYSLTKGVFISLLHSCVASDKCLITATAFFPYFSVPLVKSDCVFALKELLYFMKTIHFSQEFLLSLLHIEYILKSLKFLDIFQEFPDYLNGFEMLLNTFRDGKSLLVEIDTSSKDLKAWTETFPFIQEQFSKVFSVFQGFHDISTFNIVHFLQSESNQTGISL